MAKLGLIAAFVVLALLLTNCSEETIAPQKEPIVYPLADSMHWSPIDIIWQKEGTKNPYSLLVVSASWCGWCKKLETITFADKSVMGMVGKYFNACVIDGDCDSIVVLNKDTTTCREAAIRYGVTGVPTTIFFDSVGNRISVARGYFGPEAYAEILWGVVHQPN